MDVQQQRALNALEPFIVLSKTATSSRALADLVVQATSAPGTWVFMELMQAPNMQNLRNSSEHSNYWSMLENFAWGTVAEYAAETPPLPELNEAQTHKLKLLSILTLCRTPEKLTYATLQKELDVPDAPALEKLVIEAVYAGLIDGKLDPLNQVVRVSSIAPLRDVNRKDIPGMIATLGAWRKACETELENIEAEIEAIRKRARLRKLKELREERQFEEALKEGEKGGKRTAPMGGNDSLTDLMDVDEGIADGRTSGRVAKRIGREGLDPESPIEYQPPPPPPRSAPLPPPAAGEHQLPPRPWWHQGD